MWPCLMLTIDSDDEDDVIMTGMMVMSTSIHFTTLDI